MKWGHKNKNKNLCNSCHVIFDVHTGLNLTAKKGVIRGSVKIRTGNSKIKKIWPIFFSLYLQLYYSIIILHEMMFEKLGQMMGGQIERCLFLYFDGVKGENLSLDQI